MHEEKKQVDGDSMKGIDMQGKMKEETYNCQSIFRHHCRFVAWTYDRDESPLK